MRNKVTAILDHLCEILEGDVSARRRIVETAVGILLTTTGFASLAISLFGMLMCAVSRLEGVPPSATIQRINGSAASKTRRRMTVASVANIRLYTRRDDRRRGSCLPLLSLWQDYVTALLTDLTLPEAVQDWAARCSEHLGDLGPGDEAVRGQLPPLNRQLAPRPLPAPRERDDAVGDLALRLARLEQRVAALERGKRPTAVPRGGRSRRSALETVLRALDIEIGVPRRGLPSRGQAYRRHPFAATAPHHR